MAKAKKKEALTPEERLQAALVPDWEQPYKVPENWCWTYLKPISKIRTGKKDANYGSVDGEYPFFTCAAEPIRCHGYSFDCNAILLAGNGDINNISLYNGKFEAYQRTYVVEIIEPISIDYVFYWFKYRWFDFNKDKMFGTAIPYIRLGNLQEFPIPVPPLTQQQRIVDRIESLFAKLDEAKQKAQDALDSFETRKAAILHKAFTGELTAQWRKEHGVGMESWSWMPLKKCGSWHGGGTPSMSHPEYWENGTLLWVTSKDMKSDLIEDTLMHTNMLGVENSSANYIAEPAVLFVMRSGILRRTFPVCIVKKSFTVNQDLKALVPTDDISLEYLFWVCKANERKILEKCMKSGTTVESINATALRDFEIPIAGDNEQTEIVRILDDLLAKEQQAKEAAEAVLEQIDLVKKSILARAFRGELGTNDPAEESAVELVRNII